MIEVFKTNVEHASDANTIVHMLLQYFPGSRINFDLQDCDKILRVEGKDFSTQTILTFMKENGFYCSILD